uniref:Uncharacterized protein n=1 Tax=Arundo donax TaxID=35708 RepID=A0A0A9F6N4_ARUDO
MKAILSAQAHSFPVKINVLSLKLIGSQRLNVICRNTAK